MGARVDCPGTAAPYGSALNSAFTGKAVTLTASDTSNYNSVKLSNLPGVLIIYGGSAGGTYTIQSSADYIGRTGDLTTLTIAAYAVHCIFFNSQYVSGWNETDGTIWVKGSATTVTFGFITIPM